MGRLLATNGFLERVVFVFVQILSLSKLFVNHLKLSIADEKNLQDDSMAEEEDK